VREFELNKLINNPPTVAQKIQEFLESGALRKQDIDADEIRGHIEKSEHNLRFVVAVAKDYHDWAVTGCYYSCYHAALALIQTRGYTSKNHLATLCVIIKEFYRRELSAEDIEILARFLDHQDILFYVESKNKREDATYTTKMRFDDKEVEQLRVKATLFVNKIKGILRDYLHEETGGQHSPVTS
jgi:uncharacterized protein (UPF0332 family)